MRNLYRIQILLLGKLHEKLVQQSEIGRYTQRLKSTGIAIHRKRTDAFVVTAWAWLWQMVFLEAERISGVIITGTHLPSQSYIRVEVN